MGIDLDLAGGRVRLPTLDDLDPAHKRVLARVDFNVPLAEGEVGDRTRLRAALPTIQELLDGGAALVLMSHLGRPKGRDPSLSMAPVGAALAELLGRPVATPDAIVGPRAESVTMGLAPGEIALLENLRFDAGEKADDPGFAAALARHGDVFVNDAFGTAHRASASVVGVTRFLPSYAGRLMQKELQVLTAALASPDRPFVVVLGGAKIGDKIGVIRSLLPRADRILLGGGMANTLLAADGVALGESLVESDRIDTARELLEEGGDKLVLPTDLVVADGFSAEARTRTIEAAAGVPTGWQALDIGPATAGAYAEALAGARTVVWNGPMGVFELAPFAEGTRAVARAMAELGRATTIVGGGDSVAALKEAGLDQAMTWVSTGGGASLELLEGKLLPAVKALATDRSA